ncbi:MAG: hypothetical protein HFJ60_07510 [Clostridia bacterium]|jgi:molybdenum cofactor biosynthesis enzyme MoaA|nr:hypothetical protein [Clostridia bacterium]
MEKIETKKLEIPRNEYRMSIISSCNMKCIYCHNEGNNCISMLKIEDIEKIIKESKEFGLRGIRLTRRRATYSPTNF